MAGLTRRGEGDQEWGDGQRIMRAKRTYGFREVGLELICGDRLEDEGDRIRGGKTSESEPQQSGEQMSALNNIPE